MIFIRFHLNPHLLRKSLIPNPGSNALHANVPPNLFRCWGGNFLPEPHPAYKFEPHREPKISGKFARASVTRRKHRVNPIIGNLSFHIFRICPFSFGTESEKQNRFYCWYFSKEAGAWPEITKIKTFRYLNSELCREGYRFHN